MSFVENKKDSFIPLNEESENQIIENDPFLIEESIVKLLDISEREKDKSKHINPPKTNPKNCSIELCRILAGFFVVNCHLITHGIHGIPNYPKNSLTLLNNIALTCNSLFILISSFFLCDSRFSITRIIRFWIITVINLYYAYYIMEKIGLGPFTSQDTYRCIYWFFEVKDLWYSVGHLTFIFIMPIISKLTEKISKRSHFVIVLFLIYIISIGNSKPSSVRLSVGYNADLFLVIAILASFYKKYLFEKSVFWGFPFLYILYVYQIKFLRHQITINPKYHVIIKTFFNGFFAHSISGTSQILMSFCIFHILSHITVPSFLYYPLTFLGKGVYGSYVIGDNERMRRGIYKKIKVKELIKLSNNMIKPTLMCASKMYACFILMSGLLNIPLDLLIFERDYYKKYARIIDNFFN